MASTAAQTNADQIALDSLGPSKASGDSGMMEDHPVGEKIQAARFAAACRAGPLGGMRRVRLLPGSPSGVKFGDV